MAPSSAAGAPGDDVGLEPAQRLAAARVPGPSAARPVEPAPADAVAATRRA